MERYDDYDEFAWVYNRSLGPEAIERSLSAIERLLLCHLTKGANVLDLCCGTGQLAGALVERGFKVSGIDGSNEMLRHARDNAPRADFVLDDARSFELSPRFHAVVSAFDSLNHVMHLEELCAVFRNVYACLQGGGYFLMDLNMDEGYRARWRGCATLIDEDYVCIIRPSYDDRARIGRASLTIFRPEQETWRRSDVDLTQRCYSMEELNAGLTQAGFENIQTFDALNDLELAGGIGRTYFLVQKLTE